MESYSNALLKFIAVHYCDIMWGKITPEEMQDFTKSAGRKNPLETAMIWRADFDTALVSLSGRFHGWQDALRDGMSESMILHLCRSNEVSNMQRSIINDCILKGCGKACKRTGNHGPDICWNEGIISRMRHYLNGEYTARHVKARNGQGCFSTGS